MKDRIIEILNETRPEFDFSQEGINFVESGYLDSFDVITIVADLEETFGVKIDGALIVPENLKDVESIQKLIEASK